MSIRAAQGLGCRRAFCREHWPFFWSNAQKTNFLTHYVDILWPDIDRFIQIHDDQKGSDYFAAGKAMQEAISNAKVKAPDWPPKPGQSPTSKPPPPPPVSRHSRDLDDDIPF